MLNVIDDMVLRYAGHTHDQIFAFDLGFVIDLDVRGRKKAFSDAKQSEERQKDK